MSGTGKIAHPSQPAFEGDRLISIKTVMALTSWSRASIYRLVDAELLPRPVKIGQHRIAFSEAAIKAYVAAKLRPHEAAPSTAPCEQIERDGSKVRVKPASQHVVGA
jgi:predicted DNA-binding transcriptional regulator AlpA